MSRAVGQHPMCCVAGDIATGPIENSSGEIVGTHNGTIFADDLTARINELLLLNG